MIVLKITWKVMKEERNKKFEKGSEADGEAQWAKR